MAVKTDLCCARAIAHLLRMGWYRAVHRKSASSQEVRALLAARKQLQRTLIDLEQTMRGLLRGFGLKMGATTRGRFEERVLVLVGGHAMLNAVMRPMLRARDALRRELAVLHKRTLTIAREDEVCRRLMTVPGVGATLVAHLPDGRRRSWPLREVEGARGLLRPDAEASPVGRGRPRRLDHQGRRRRGAHRAL